MATITLKQVPTDLHRRLKRRAAQHDRSLNGEIMACLKAAVRSAPADVSLMLQQAQRLRAQVSGSLTDIDLTKFKKLGRP